MSDSARIYGARPCYTQAQDDSPADTITLWPTHEDGTPKRIHELSPEQRYQWFGRGLRGALAAFEVADQAARESLRRW